MDSLTPEARDRAEARARSLLGPLDAAGIRVVAVTFVNHTGVPLVKILPLAGLPAAARAGVGFSPVADAFGATGAIDPLQGLARPDGDLRLIPDLDGLLRLDAATGWAWAPGDRRRRDGAPHPQDQRLFCRRMEQALERQGVSAMAGFEIEWMVGLPGPAGEWQTSVPGGPYGADRMIEAIEYLGAIAEALDEACLPWLQLHPEYGSGQFELSLAPASPVEAADRLVAARLLIQRVSRRFGWRCSFSPVVAADQVGNGGHLHLSLSREGWPLFEGGEGPGGLPPAGAEVVARLLEELPALLPLACSLAVSFHRLVPGRWSAPFRVWGVENREAALRLVPAAADGGRAHLELKVADLSANPYLLLGGVLAAAVAGGTPPSLPPPVEGDPAGAADPPAPRLPATLAEALEAFAASPLLRQALGEALHRSLLEARQAEIRRSEALTPEDLIATTRWWPLAGR